MAANAPMSPIRQEPGKWYFGYRCRLCSEMFALFEDASEGGAPYPHQGGMFAVQCRCGHTATYVAGSIESFQAPPELGQRYRVKYNFGQHGEQRLGAGEVERINDHEAIIYHQDPRNPDQVARQIKVPVDQLTPLAEGGGYSCRMLLDV